MNADEMNELKDDMRTDMMNEAHDEHLLRTDISHCLEHLNVLEVADSIHELQRKLSGYNHVMTRKDLYEYIEEYM